MTRREFIDDCTGVWQLRDFARENNLDAQYDFDDVYHVEDIDEVVEAAIEDYLRMSSWRDLMRDLNDIDDLYDYVRHEGGLCFEQLHDEDIDDLKDRIIEEMDENDAWDDEDDEDFVDEPVPEEPEEEPEEETEDDNGTIDDLFGGCNEAFAVMISQIPSNNCITYKED